MAVFVKGKPPLDWKSQVKSFVRERYAHLVGENTFPEGGSGRAHEAGYPAGWLDSLPLRVSGAYCGCGYALEGIDLSGAHLAVDLGCGAGLDSRLAAEALPEGGRVLALDMVVPMLWRVKEAAGERGAVYPVAGDMECLPIASNSADIVMANASLNLLLDKAAALAEIWRILRPGARLIARELIREGELPVEIAQDPTAWNASLGGVLEEGEWLRLLKGAGFSNVVISGHRPFRPVIAVRIEAVKPFCGESMSSESAEADRLTQEALSNWYVRLLANGISYADASDVIPRVGSWRDWCSLWIERAALREAEAEEMARSGRRLSAAEGFVRAALAYHFAQFVYHEDLDLKREAQEKKVACHTRALADLCPPGERVEIPFEGASLPGVLRFPAKEENGAPLIILIAGLDSTKEEFYTLEAVLHARGLATLAFDGPAQGERSALPLRPDFEAAVSAAVNFISKDGRVNPARLGALGVSCGGYYAPRALAVEGRLVAAVGIAGFYDLAECWEGLPALTRQGFSVAFGNISKEEAADCAKNVSMRGMLKGLERPLLLIHGEKDRLCPVGQARQMAEEAGNQAELVVYPEGVHVCNNIPFLWRPLAADWLADKLSGRS
ncbi:MAG TPA: hypothetical protein DDZ83_01530 [Nitrospinae bacterium]|nr:hypothetical protein [Nitrospinota bacterium]